MKMSRTPHDGGANIHDGEGAVFGKKAVPSGVALEPHRFVQPKPSLGGHEMARPTTRGSRCPRTPAKAPAQIPAHNHFDE